MPKNINLNTGIIYNKENKDNLNDNKCYIYM